VAKRRANKEGTIYCRKDGRWVAAVMLPDGRRKSYYGKTRDEVAQKLTRGLKTIQDGLPVPSDQLRVGRYLQEWLQSARHSIRPSTWQRYEQLLRVYAMPAIGTLTLSRLEPRHLHTLYADCLTRGAAPATVRQLHAVLRRALGQATQWGTVPRNVAALVSPPRLTRHEITPLTPEQARMLLAAVKGDRLEAFYTLAISTGMRLGELLGLRWRDVDLEAGMLQVRHTLVRGTGHPVLAKPKSPRSRRRLALTAATQDALRHHRRQQAAERLRLGPVWDDHDLVFPNAIGKPMDAGNLQQRSFVPLLRKAGLPRIRFHDLRHTAATLLLVQGVHVKVVSEMLGHSSIAITLDTYSHVLPDMQQDAAAAMDRLLHDTPS
jgi:integrase